MSHVRYPKARRNILRSLASLADSAYQEHVWIREEDPDVIDSFHDTVEDLDIGHVLSNPERAVGDVLIEGPEVERLEVLSQAVDALIARHPDGRDEDYINDEAWPDIQRLACSAMTAMVIAGGLD